VSLRLEMLAAARRAPRLLGESAELVRGYLRSQMNPDGGFRDRAGASDVYYTVFGLEGLAALEQFADPRSGRTPARPAMTDSPSTVDQEVGRYTLMKDSLNPDIEFDRVAGFLKALGGGETLDLVHAACLARCWANLPAEMKVAMPRAALVERVNAFRSADGAYNGEPGSPQGTLYDCLLAVEALRDLEADLQDPAAVIACVQRLKMPDGGYAGMAELPVSLTPTTGAAVTLLCSLGEPVVHEVAAWLLARHCPPGGFVAAPATDVPDLLSTATALHALASLGIDLGPLREPCLDFIDSLWSNRGAFCGSWTDDTPDCEYTYYALLALGHLSP
jgi:prenyltransferase beta subunit